ncbi:hypothetical protein [Caballeronia sp. AZ10_KS36]|uniref:hypothetical protein n=1 Tax=Caballeronia sp. AZ10_KS36 TaxID=2921757 RepID=UPI002028276B|nr:hypothetical protein [Caballeronia sp. AZ10_KS36]
MPTDRQRWLHAKRVNTGRPIALCEYTKVVLIKSSEGHAFFTVADGTSDYVGETVFISDQFVDRFLSKTPPSMLPTTLSVKYATRSRAISAARSNEVLDQQWGTLRVSGGNAISVTLNSLWGGQYTPIPPGVHRIMAPDAPHDASYTNFYVDFAARTGMGEVIADQVWFPIELAGSEGNSTRYVHVGNLSEGCVTVYALDRWNEVYNCLISHRLPDTQGRYVANLEVTK